MAKTDLTKAVEKAVLEHNDKMGIFSCVEVPIGHLQFSNVGITDKIELVDVMTYESNSTIRCWEIKVSLSDLKSKAALSFFGDYNYLVLPEELYKEARNKGLMSDFFWQGIGVFVFLNGKLYCEKKAKKKSVDLGVKQLLLESMTRALARDAKKYYSHHYNIKI